MAVKVKFPDGTMREVRSITRAIVSREIPRQATRLVEEPAFDPKWRFIPVIGGWLARPRT
jgi:hypothetical protein